MKVLIVDNDSGALKAMEGQLRGEYEVLPAGPEAPVPDALDIWNGDPRLSLAIVDLKMAEEEGGAESEEVGFRLIEKLKKIRPDARVAVRSALDSHEVLARAIEVEADAFVGNHWDAPDFLANVHFMKQRVTRGPMYRVLSRSIEARGPYRAGHRYRVVEYCRAILIHLNEAEPPTFDLAACLAAADLHDVYKCDMREEFLLDPHAPLNWQDREVQDRHVKSAEFIGGLAPGFRKVAEIVKQYPRCYDEPTLSSVPDYPDDPGLRGNGIKLEARVLHVADTLDTWAADRFDRPGLDLKDIKLALQDAYIVKSFDPSVAVAAIALIEDDSDRFNEIFRRGKLHRTAGLRLQFNERLWTAGRLLDLLNALSVVDPVGGGVVDRLAVYRLEKGTGGATKTKVTLAGLPEDIDHAHEVFTRRMEAAAQQPGPTEAISGELADAFLRRRGVVPLEVKKCGLDDD